MLVCLVREQGEQSRAIPALKEHLVRWEDAAATEGCSIRLG